MISYCKLAHCKPHGRKGFSAQSRSFQYPCLEKRVIFKYVQIEVADYKLFITRCTTAKSFRIFAKNHQNLRMKEILTIEQNRSGAKFEGPFGIKTQL
jgi:hypothetical protein